MSRGWVDDAKKKPVDKRWVMRCDVGFWDNNQTRCDTTSDPVAHQSHLPLDRFRDEGWFIAATGYADICPRCLASGVVPSRSPYFKETAHD